MDSDPVPTLKTAERKGFLRSEDFKKLLAQFVLTSIIGGGLTMYWQYNASLRSSAEQVRASEVKAATDAFNEISRLLDKRLYRTRQFFWSQNGKTAGVSTEERRRAYLEVIGEWNETLNRNYAITERYFGSTMRARLERTIAEELRCISELIIGRGVSPKEVEERLDTLNVRLYEFNLQMLAQIQNASVGVLRNRSEDARAIESPRACPVLPAPATSQARANRAASSGKKLPNRNRTRQ